MKFSGTKGKLLEELTEILHSIVLPDTLRATEGGGEALDEHVGIFELFEEEN